MLHGPPRGDDNVYAAEHGEGVDVRWAIHHGRLTQIQINAAEDGGCFSAFKLLVGDCVFRPIEDGKNAHRFLIFAVGENRQFHA